MNKIINTAIFAAVLFSLSPASASDGILFSNPSDPYFTTPEEFRALGQGRARVPDSRNQDISGSNRPAKPTILDGQLRNDPMRGGFSGS